MRRLKSRLANIEVDNFAIARDGGVGKMVEEEVVRACEERGIDVLEGDGGDKDGRNESKLRAELEDLLEKRMSGKLEEGEKIGVKAVEV